MTIQEHIKNDMVIAMREKRVEMRDLLRVVMAEFSRINKEVSDEQALAVINSLSKKTKENILMFSGEDKEKAERELVILELYLPSQMDEVELEKIIQHCITFNSYSTMKDMGKVMGYLKKTHDGTYDGKMASNIVRGLLG